MPPWKRICYSAKLNEIKVERHGNDELGNLCRLVRRKKRIKVDLIEPKETRDETGEVTFEWNQFHGSEYHYQYMLAWIVEHEQKPEPDNEVSHLCGNDLCINVNHMTEESHDTNQERIACHTKIRKWIKKQRKPKKAGGKYKSIRKGYYTFSDLQKGCRCPHFKSTGKECFITYGAVRSHQKGMSNEHETSDTDEKVDEPVRRKSARLQTKRNRSPSVQDVRNAKRQKTRKKRSDKEEMDASDSD